MKPPKELVNALWPNNPRAIFLLDARGALLTALILSQVIATNEETFGMPADVVRILALTAGFFAGYSYSCYRWLTRSWRPFLKTIAILNVIYCISTVCLLVYYHDSNKVPGLVYFIAESVVILLVVMMEVAMLRSRQGDQEPASCRS